MPTLHVKDVPEDVYRAVAARARRAGRSLAAEVRKMLEEGATSEHSLEGVVRSIEHVRRAYPPKKGKPGVDKMLAEDRGR